MAAEVQKSDDEIAARLAAPRTGGMRMPAAEEWSAALDEAGDVSAFAGPTTHHTAVCAISAEDFDKIVARQSEPPNVTPTMTEANRRYLERLRQMAEKAKRA